MSIETEKEIPHLIASLIEHIKKIVAEARNSGQLIPQKEQFQKWILKDFKYTDNGVESTGASGQYISKPNWTHIEITLSNVIEKHESYKNLVDKTESPSGIFGDIVDAFTNKMIRYCLEHESINESEIDNFKQILIKEINSEPVKSGSIVSLVGIALRPKIIKISNTISIRQTQKKDLEKEIPTHGFHSMNNHQYPSAMMTIEDYSDNPYEFQRKELAPITILRLFKVASVRWIQSQMFTESLRGMTGGTMSGINTDHIILHTGVIKESEEKLLVHFWKNIEKHLPKSFYDLIHIETSYSDIAYSRYCDALLKPGPEEFRITNAMMGLESIFLRDGGELQELSYRLSLRTAKLISGFGYNAFEISKIIKDAYQVRSSFVHGGVLSYKKKKKLIENYGSMNELIQKLLDFLRLAIIISITITVSKEELIDTIDESFLDTKSQDKLNRLMNPAKGILSISIN